MGSLGFHDINRSSGATSRIQSWCKRPRLGISFKEFSAFFREILERSCKGGLHRPSIPFQLSTIMIASGLVLNASFIPWLQKHRKACFFTMGYDVCRPAGA